MQIQNLQTHACEVATTSEIPFVKTCHSQFPTLTFAIHKSLCYYFHIIWSSLNKLYEVSMNHQVKAILSILLQNSIKEINRRALLTHMHTPKRDFNYQLLQMHPQTSRDWDLSILELHPKYQFQRRNFL
jgi:hypothetical protein